MMRLLSFALVLLALLPLTAHAQTAGAACTTAGQFHESGTESLVCDSSVWKPVMTYNTAGKINFQVGNDTGSCTTVKTGRLRYSSATWEYCNGTAWAGLPVGGGSECNIIGQNVGYVCPDGSVFAGFSFYTNHYRPIFTTRCDAGRIYGGSCAGVRVAPPFNNGNTTGVVQTGIIDSFDGAANTAALIITDSDSGVGGTQPHLAAQYCADLVIHGKSDWYLPSAAELGNISVHYASIPDFLTAGNFYWTSTEYSWGAAADVEPERAIIAGGGGKEILNNLRCIRK